MSRPMNRSGYSYPLSSVTMPLISFSRTLASLSYICSACSFPLAPCLLFSSSFVIVIPSLQVGLWTRFFVSSTVSCMTWTPNFFFLSNFPPVSIFVSCSLLHFFIYFLLSFISFPGCCLPLCFPPHLHYSPHTSVFLLSKSPIISVFLFPCHVFSGRFASFLETFILARTWTRHLHDPFVMISVHFALLIYS
ncbi:uncharacterized protein EI90DRAFT_498677 [Cantharellus anzutake]|uniref:uncharacterized protein n=1 Tax=Cantharellus anzutake TaxID=1750568 RepID=UPI0019040248|nr:uncharacterized protein EI90DRAFT_498677 [Cantharellus anzutake]KAF8334021.1 hypothetical protein EI90DRAFT_498677 [Cantharellus anzutake]